MVNPKGQFDLATLLLYLAEMEKNNTRSLKIRNDEAFDAAHFIAEKLGISVKDAVIWVLRREAARLIETENVRLA